MVAISVDNLVDDLTEVFSRFIASMEMDCQPMDSSRKGSKITIPVCHVSPLCSSVSGVLDLFDTCDSS